MWVRAVWDEEGTEEEGTVPSTWIRDGLLYWPNTSNALRAMTSGKVPTGSWRKFTLVKEKFRSESRDQCEAYDHTTSAETEDEIADVNVSRQRKKKVWKDFCSGTESRDSDEMPIRKKPRSNKSADIQMPLPPTKPPVRTRSPSPPSNTHSLQLQSKTPPPKKSATPLEKTPSSGEITPVLQKNTLSTLVRESPRDRLDTSVESRRPSANWSPRRSPRNALLHTQLRQSPTGWSERVFGRNSLSQSPVHGSLGRQSPQRSARRQLTQRSPQQNFAEISVSQQSPQSSQQGHSPQRSPRGQSLERSPIQQSPRRSPRRQLLRIPSVEDYRNEIDMHSRPVSNLQRPIIGPSVSQRPSRPQLAATHSPQEPYSQKSLSSGGKRNADRYPLPQDVFQRKIFQMLAEMRMDIRELKERGEMGLTGDICDIPFTAQSYDEFMSIEDSLSSPEDCSKLMRALARVGGNNTSDVAIRILRRLMSHDVMALFSLKGKKGKRSFQSLKIFKPIRDAVVKTVACTDAAAEMAIANALKYAPDRCGRRRQAEN